MRRLLQTTQWVLDQAHKLVAISIARQIEIAKDKALLSKLRHHLIASRDLSPEIEQIWASYYIATEQRDKAIASLDRAAEKRPAFYITISKLYKQGGQNAESVNALKKAETAFRKTFKKDELDTKIGLLLRTFSRFLKSTTKLKVCYSKEYASNLTN